MIGNARSYTLYTGDIQLIPPHAALKKLYLYLIGRTEDHIKVEVEPDHPHVPVCIQDPCKINEKKQNITGGTAKGRLYLIISKMAKFEFEI